MQKPKSKQQQQEQQQGTQQQQQQQPQKQAGKEVPQLDSRSRLMQFTPCATAGATAVQWVKITPCEVEPCIFKPMTEVTITVAVVAPMDVTSAKLHAYLPGMSQPFPGFAMDICKQVSCPIRKGTPLQLTQTVTVPPVPTRVRVLLNPLNA